MNTTSGEREEDGQEVDAKEGNSETERMSQMYWQT